MLLCSGTSSSTEETARLCVVPDGDSGALAAGVQDTGGAEDVREGQALLYDAATLVAARPRLDGLLLQLTVNPFDPAAGSVPISWAQASWPLLPTCV